jgi:hypothetical protein
LVKVSIDGEALAVSKDSKSKLSITTFSLATVTSEKIRLGKNSLNTKKQIAATKITAKVCIK